MYITPVSSYNNFLHQRNNPISFKSYKNDNQVKANVGDDVRYYPSLIYNFTSLFRDTELFLELPQLLKNRFPDGVKIYDYGCSAGYEPVSIVLGLHNSLPEKEINKYTPIIARDNNSSIIEMAKNRKLEFEDEELLRLESFNNIDKNMFFDISTTDDDNKEIYEYKDILKNEIIFEEGDLFDDLENGKLSKEPCVVLLRNAWQYMKPKGKIELAQKLYDNLQPGSVVIIGKNDLGKCVDRFLFNSGFKNLKDNYNIAEYANSKNRLPNEEQYSFPTKCRVSNYCFVR